MRAAWLRCSFAFSLCATTALAGCSTESVTPVPTDASAKDPTGPLGNRADLPVDERITLESLGAPVDIVRDKYGRPHLYATSVNDAMRAEGYLVARDRAIELEFFRRVSEGRLAELFSNL